ncbi:hypothetical protein ACI65C_013063, partial [Semiaphis heraclei]
MALTYPKPYVILLVLCISLTLIQNSFQGKSDGTDLNKTSSQNRLANLKEGNQGAPIDIPRPGPSEQSRLSRQSTRTGRSRLS